MHTRGTYTRSLTVEASFIGDTAELVIIGHLNPGNRPVLADMLTMVLGQQPAGLVFDLSRVRSMDIAAAQMIAEATRQLRGGRPPVIRRASLRAARLLHAAGLDIGLAETIS